MQVRTFQDPKEKKRRGPWSFEWRENGRRRSKAVGMQVDAEHFAAIKRAELVDRTCPDEFVAKRLAMKGKGGELHAADSYPAHLPDSRTEQRKNAESNSGKPPLRAVAGCHKPFHRRGLHK